MALAGLASVIVVALVATLPTLVVNSSGQRQDANGLSTTASAVPAGLQAVSFRGVQILVPAAWKLRDTRCGTPVGDTVIVYDGTIVPFCAVPRPPGLTVVRMLSADSAMGANMAKVADRRVTVDGRAGRRGTGIPPYLPGGTVPAASVLVLPGPGVVISIESPHQTLAERILDSTSVSTG